MQRARLVIVISGRGRNLQALIAAVNDGRIPAEIVSVICNRDDAPGLVHAHAAGLPVILVPHAEFASRNEFDRAFGDALRAQSADIVALAGFMRILGADVVREFEGRMLNIHPSLLPRHKGLDTHARALEAGDAEHGATVHFVTPQLDGGPRVIQGRFMVEAHDDAQTLAQRAMEQVELKIYPQAIAWMARGQLRLAGSLAMFRNQPLAEPLSLDDLEPEFR